MSPLAGMLSDKANPKLPAFVGMALLGISLYLNSSLSLYTEHAYIMLSLYIRGLGLGLMFTPLSSIALSDIPRDKMGQASGLFNVIRQIGGSFGVAILGTMLSRRTQFHLAMYGQAVDRNSPAFQQTTLHLQQFIQHSVGGTFAASAMRANALLGAHLGEQAFISAINDDFMLAGIITLLGALPVFFLRVRKLKKTEHIAALE